MFMTNKGALIDTGVFIHTHIKVWFVLCSS